MQSELDQTVHYAYVDEFCHVVKTLYSHLLSESESSQLKLLTSLPPPLRWRVATLLYRLADYISIPDRVVDEHLAEELASIGVLCREHPDTLTVEALSVASKERLIAACLKHELKISSSLSKQSLLQKMADSGVLFQLAKSFQIYKICGKAEFDILRLLFFGKFGETFGGFFMRDFRESGRQSPIRFKPFVENREQLTVLLELETRKTQFRESPPDSGVEFLDWIEQLKTVDFLKCAHLKTRSERAVLSLARTLEDAGKIEAAAEVFTRIRSFKGLSDSLRLLKKVGKTDVARRHAENMLAEKATPNIAQYASDFLHGTKSSLRPAVLNTLLKDAELISLTEPSGAGVELDVCQYISDKDTTAIHLENWLVHELYERFCEFAVPDLGSANTLDRFSTERFTKDFYLTHRDEIVSGLSCITDSGKELIFCRPLTENELAPYLKAFNAFVNVTPAKNLALLIEEIFPAPRENLVGYPDLLVVEKNSIWFAEVKGPGDSVRMEQHAAMLRLQRCGFVTKIFKVEYASQLPKANLQTG